MFPFIDANSIYSWKFQFMLESIIKIKIEGKKKTKDEIINSWV